MVRLQNAVAAILVSSVPVQAAWASLGSPGALTASLPEATPAQTAPQQPATAQAAPAQQAASAEHAAPAQAVPVQAVRPQAAPIQQAAANGASAPSDPCADLADHTPDADLDSAIRFADQVAACGHAELAESLYREALTQMPPAAAQRLAALSGLAASLKQQDRVTEAEAVFEQILRLSSVAPSLKLATHPALDRSSAAKRAIGLRGPEPASPTSPTSVARIDKPGVVAAASEERWATPDGQSSISARLEDVRYEAQDKSIGARVARPGIRMQQRIADGVELNGDVGADRMEIRGAGYASTRLNYNTGLRFQRDNLIRIDLNSNRASTGDVMTLQRGPIATVSTAAMDFRPTDTSRYAMRYQRATFSDGNQTASTQFETEYRIGWGSNIWMGGRSTHSDWADPASGYASYRSVDSRMLTLRLEDETRLRSRKLGYAVTLGLGDGLFSHDVDRPQYDLTLRGSYRMPAGTVIEAKLQSMRLNTSTTGPLMRNLAGVSLNMPW